MAQDVLPPVEANPLVIGHDVWIGDGVVILPGYKSIGNGAVIGARSVATRDVPQFAVVARSLAKPLRKRFPPEVEAVVAGSEWWLRPLEDLASSAELFTQPLEELDCSSIAQLSCRVALRAGTRQRGFKEN